MGQEPFGAEEEQRADQILAGSLDEYQMLPGGSDAEKKPREDQVEDGNLLPNELGLGPIVIANYQVADAHLGAWEWEGDPTELEISEEVVQVPVEVTPSSMTPPSISTSEETSPSTDGSPAVQNDERPSNKDAQSSSASNDTNSANEWFCDFTNCGKSFTHRHKLKYVNSVPSTPQPLANMIKPPP